MKNPACWPGLSLVRVKILIHVPRTRNFIFETYFQEKISLQRATGLCHRYFSLGKIPRPRLSSVGCQANPGFRPCQMPLAFLTLDLSRSRIRVSQTKKKTPDLLGLSFWCSTWVIVYTKSEVKWSVGGKYLQSRIKSLYLRSKRRDLHSKYLYEHNQLELR